MSILLPDFLDLLDILVVAVVIYKMLQALRRSGGGQILAGVLMLLLLYVVAAAFNLRLITTLLGSLKNIWIILLVIMFQPELRAAMVRMTAERGWHWRAPRLKTDVFLDAVYQMSESKTGALIVFEKKQSLDAVLTGAEMINSEVTTKLLLTVFNKYTPMHDGAVIIRNGRLLACKAVLPLSVNPSYAGKLGTRHLAGLGVTEHYDAYVVIVSEETGHVSFAWDGVLYRHLSSEELTQRLADASK